MVMNKFVNSSIQSISKVLPIKSYNQLNQCFYSADGFYFDILKIVSKDWQSKTENEATFDIIKWCRLYRTYGDDLKIFSLNFKMVTQYQQDYIKNRLNNQKNPYLRRCLERKLKELENLEKYNTAREFYLMIFGESMEAIERNRLNIISKMSRQLVQTMDENKKIQILFKLCNKNLNVKPVDINLQENIQPKETDKNLIHYIAPRGRISFKDEKIIKTGNGYEACIHIYGYPPRVSRFWLTTVCNINDVVTFIDIGTDNIVEVKKNINKSISEQVQRAHYVNDYSEKYDAEVRAEELKELYHEIESMGEIIKLVHIRIFVTGKTINEIEINTKKILDSFEGGGYSASVFLNESKNEWETMFLPYSMQGNDKAYAIEPQEFKAVTLAGGLPFYFSSLEDKYGTLLGYTPCRGNVLFDLFCVSEKRTHFNSVVVGGMGTGKSSLLKKQFYDRASRGDFVRTFDITGEFRYLTEMTGGKFLKLDGSNGIINPLEILPGAENEIGNYTIHLSRLSTFYKLFSPEVSRDEIDTFEELVNKIYVKFGFIENDGFEVRHKEKLSGLPAEKYPIFSDLIVLADEEIKELSKKKETKLESQITVDKIKRIDKVKRTITNLVMNYGQLINGPTSFDNITDTQIVTFDISTLRNMKAEIFDALIFNALSLCWGNAVKNGQIMKELYETKKMSLSEVVHTLIIIDESHNWINTKKIAAVEQVTIFAREGRKFFCGIIMASQSIRDYVPEGSTEQGFNAIKILFELSQYKFIFRQDNNVTDLLSNIFKGQLTPSEIDRIPNLERGQCILSITSDCNVETHVFLTDEELEMFRGGV